MDHKTALREMAVEKYLLDEFDTEERDTFEEHFFSCDECARDVKDGAALMAHGKEIFRREREAARQAEHQASAPSQIRPRRRSRFAWLWPNFAVPAMALMLGVLVFQNLVQLPAMHNSLMAMNAPGVLPSVYVPSGSSRGDDRVVVARPGEVFLLTIDIRDTSEAAHTAALYDATGRQMWSLPIPPEAPKESLALKLPGDLPEGSFSLVVKRAGSTDSSEVGRYAFVLRRS